MSRVLVTGSTEGLGLMAARLLPEDGHSVTLHARSAGRAEDARAALPAARAVVAGDLSSIAGMGQVAEQANAGAPYDAVIHNAGVGYREPRRIRADDGLEHVFAINVLAPYLLTGLIDRPGRMVYLSSGMHRGGNPGLADPQLFGSRGGEDAFAGKGAGREHGSRHGLADPHDVLGTLLAQVVPGRRGEPVGVLFDLTPQGLSLRGQRALIVEQAAVRETADGAVPLVLAPPAAGPGELREEPFPGRGMGDQRLDAAQSRAGQRARVTVAAVLA
jgi:hypothetical protein